MLHVDFYFIIEGTRPFTAKNYNILLLPLKPIFIYNLYSSLRLREEGGADWVLCGEAELKTVTETGNGFNRVGLPLSALPQQAWRIIQDYQACLWSAVQGLLPTFYLVLPVMYEGERIVVAVDEEVKLCSHVSHEGKKEQEIMFVVLKKKMQLW